MKGLVFLLGSLLQALEAGSNLYFPLDSASIETRRVFIGYINQMASSNIVEIAYTNIVLIT